MLQGDLSALLPNVEEEVLVSIERPGTPLGELSRHFADPRDLFICAPQPVDVHTLARLYYADEEGHVDGERVMAMRRRAREERWREARTMFQSRRSAVMRERVLEVEATAWAMLGADFHLARMRSLWDRWEMLNAAVLEQLSRIEAGQRPFDNALRDMAKELRDVENDLMSIMPKLELTEKAQRVWTGRAQSRSELVQSIGTKMRSVASGEAAREVFKLIDGGLTSDED